MKNTERFYKRAKEFQDKRADIQKRYESNLKDLENKKGSSYYSLRLKEIEDEYTANIEALKAEYKPYFKTILSDMNDINDKRGITPPTDEELRLIQLLKLKEKITEKELEAAAVTLAGNDTCLSILTEMAHNQGYMQGYMHYSKNPYMPYETTKTVINDLMTGINDFMNHDTTKASRAIDRYNTEHYGKNNGSLTKRNTFTDIQGCYKEIAGLTPSEYEKLSETVDN